MIFWLVIFSGLSYTIGNATYLILHYEPKLVWGPLASFLLLCLVYIKSTIVWYDKLKLACINWLVCLAAGNLVKQLFYTSTIKQINDYIYGAAVTVGFIIYILKNRKKWEIQRIQQSGENGHRV